MNESESAEFTREVSAMVAANDMARQVEPVLSEAEVSRLRALFAGGWSSQQLVDFVEQIVSSRVPAQRGPVAGS